MANEDVIVQDIKAKFGIADDKIRVQRARRIWLDIPGKELQGLFEHVVKGMGFRQLCTITGLDEGEELSFIYHLAKDDGTMLNVKARVPKADPVHPTVSNFFPASVLPERELIDLLGAKITGLPAGNRYPLPEDWPAGVFPLRKDWSVPKKDESSVAGPDGAAKK